MDNSVKTTCFTDEQFAEYNLLNKREKFLLLQLLNTEIIKRSKFLAFEEPFPTKKTQNYDLYYYLKAWNDVSFQVFIYASTILKHNWYNLDKSHRGAFPD